MSSRHTRVVRSVLSDAERAEMSVVDSIAERPATHLESKRPAIESVHVHRASSSAVQAVVGDLLREIGFAEEVVLTPQDGFVTRARPDFVHTLGPVHIAQDAQHLFLVVPAANWNEAGRARERPDARVAHRRAAFFGDPRRQVDVLSAHVFGYGSDAPVVLGA